MTPNMSTISNTTLNRRRGGQSENANAMTHGLRAGASVIRLNLGALPPSMARIERAVNSFRRVLEGAVIQTHGCVNLIHAALINSASRHETHALRVQRWLRLNSDSLDANQRLAYSKAIADASTARDRCLERLGLDGNGADAFEDYYRERPAVAAIEHQSDAGADADAP
jgi:hypothetical protein